LVNTYVSVRASMRVAHFNASRFPGSPPWGGPYARVSVE
jgi:hypothetical protein